MDIFEPREEYLAKYTTQSYKQNPVDMDYFLSFLRNNNCSTKDGLEYCSELCRGVPVVCHRGDCFCHQSVVDAVLQPKLLTSLDLMMPPDAIAAPKNEVQINISPQIVPKSETHIVPVIMMTDEYLQGRRHQIAHFCPSLDAARECINKCVALGKPAFCGKDHKCYCGHKYSDHDSKDQQDALDVYKQFADMYAKYFGNAERDTGSDENGDYDELKKKREKNIKKIKSI